MLLNISTFTENELKWDAGTIDSSLLKNNTKKLAVNRNITRKSCGNRKKIEKKGKVIPMG